MINKRLAKLNNHLEKFLESISKDYGQNEKNMTHEERKFWLLTMKNVSEVRWRIIRDFDIYKPKRLK